MKKALLLALMTLGLVSTMSADWPLPPHLVGQAK